MKKRFVTVLSLVLVMLMAFGGCGADKTQTDAPSVEDTTEATTAEQIEKENMHNVFGEFTAEALDGTKVDQSVFEGKITMVSIWAVISEHSVKQLADLEKISKEYADEGLQVVGVVSNIYINPDGSCSADGVKAAKAAVEDNSVSFVNILPNAALKTAKLDLAKYIPETFFLDGDGNIIGGNYIGSKSYEDWCSIVDDVLKNS